ncbi:hypothetical protein HYT92_03695 [Candidatus Pacearchaeota archaeon]|nr:hypothetical protein [Candidatus Pacearchaeota archaeon]
MLSKVYILLGWELPGRRALIPETFEEILIGLKARLEAAGKTVERVSAGRIIVSRSRYSGEPDKQIFIYLEPSDVCYRINIEKINRTGQLKGIDRLDKESRNDFFQFASELNQLLGKHYEWAKKVKLEGVVQNLVVFCEIQFLLDELKKISEKLAPVYKLLNWEWAEEKVPSAEKIAETLKDLAASVIGDLKGYSSTGGLTVQKEERSDYLEIRFCPEIFFKVELSTPLKRLQLVNR